MTLHSYAPHDGHRLAHDPLKAIVGPRPIGWVSTVTADGRVNLAPYSFCNLLSVRPPLVGFASSGWKDSVAAIEASGEFVWNLATTALIDQVDTSGDVTDLDEFALTGLTPAASVVVAAPRVAESPASFECRVTQIVPLVDAAGDAADSWLVVGEIVHVHLDDALLVDGTWDTARAGVLLRGGRPQEYYTTTAADRLFARRG